MKNKKAILFIVMIAALYAAITTSIVISTGSEEKVIRELGNGDILQLEITGKTGPAGPMGPPGPPCPSVTGWPNIWNPKDYGATGDNPTTEEAIDKETAGFLEAISKCKKGDTLFIPNGKYVVNRELLIDKSIYITGQGHQTQIYQSADENLFRLYMSTNYMGCASTIFENMQLGSAATTEGKSPLVLDHSPYNEIRNIWLGGGNKGLYIKGSLGTQVHFARTTYYPAFFRNLPRTQAAIFGEPAYGKNINHTFITGTNIQGGAHRGIELKATNAEGGITISGLIEGVTGEAVILTGFNLSSSINSLWCEAGNIGGDIASNVVLNNVRNMSLEGCFFGGKRGLIMNGCARMDIRGGQSTHIYASENSRQIDIHGINYYTLDIHSKHTRLWNMQNMSDGGVGGYGYYSGPVGERVNPNWSLEEWNTAGKPVSYTTYGGRVTKETEIVHTGKSAARLSLTGNVSSLCLELEPSYYLGQSLSIRFYVWIPKETKGKPRIGLLYNNWYSCSFSPCFNEVEAEKWTPVCCTFYIPEEDVWRIQAILGVIYCGATEGDIIIDSISMGIFPF